MADKRRRAQAAAGARRMADARRKEGEKWTRKKGGRVFIPRESDE